MYRPAIMGLLFCSAILLGSIFCLYLHSEGRTKAEPNPSPGLELRSLTPEEISDLEATLAEWDCELLREDYGWSTSDQTH